MIARKHCFHILLQYTHADKHSRLYVSGCFAGGKRYS